MAIDLDDILASTNVAELLSDSELSDLGSQVVDDYTKDKMQRARSIQARMRAGGVRFDTEADWFPALQEQMLRFPRGAHDDYVDMLSWAGLLMDRLRNANTPEEDDDEERWNTQEYVGRSVICGY